MKNSGRPLLRMLCVTLALLAALAAPAGAVGEEKTGESKGILYRVTGGNSEMFLLGSIHVGSEEMYPMNRRITDALAAADTMVFECDTESPDVVRKMASMMSYPKGETLREHISAECYALLEQAAGKTGYPIGMLNALRPWAVVSTLTLETTAIEMGVEDVSKALTLGVEAQVKALDGDGKKAVAYLETAESQLDAMDGFSPELQEYLLYTTCQFLLDPQGETMAMDAGITAWPEWWRDGNAGAFADSYLLSMRQDPEQALVAEYHQELVTERNVNMAQELQKLLNGADEHSYFVTIGLLHLVLPEDSVPLELEKLGYTVERIE